MSTTAHSKKPPTHIANDPVLMKLYESAKRLAAIRHRKIYWGRVAASLTPANQKAQ